MIRPFSLGLAALLFFAAPTWAGSPIGVPTYEWEFFQYPSDGAGGFKSPVLLDSGEQTGGVLSEEEVIGPGIEVFASEGAEDFWATARAPHAGIIEEDDPVGARAELSVLQIFRKDASDATLQFTIPQSVLSVSDSFGPENEGLSAIVVHSLEAGDFFAFAEEARLDGNAGDWTFLESGQGLLPYEITQGGLDESGVIFAFPEPFVGTVDLSSLLVGDEFTVHYHLIADAVDTVQGKSNALAFARDLTDETDGVSFEFTGLTPIGVPEPGGALLLASGAAVMVALRPLLTSRRERRRNPSPRRSARSTTP